MTSIAEVKLWGNTLGAVTLEEGKDFASFQYDSSFVERQIEVSPLNMPLLPEVVYQFSDLEYKTFFWLAWLAC